jgi:hypothetical protein
MISTKAWENLERGISVLTAGVLAVFWLVLMKFSVMAGALALYMGYEGLRAYRDDHADEREAMISARAGYLSHKLMIAAGLLLFILVDMPAAGRAVLLTVILIGSLSEAAFRRLQGGQKRAPAPAWIWYVVGLGFLAMAWSIVSVFNHIATSFNMTLWQMLCLLYNGSPN